MPVLVRCDVFATRLEEEGSLYSGGFTSERILNGVVGIFVVLLTSARVGAADCARRASGD